MNSPDSDPLEQFCRIAHSLLEDDRPEEAADYCEAALDAGLSSRKLLTLRGRALIELGRIEEGTHAYRTAVQGTPRPHFNVALGLLLSGRLAEGFAEYDARFRKPDIAAKLKLRYDRPFWNGEPLQGRTVVVFNEQGHGDAVCNARYLPMIKERGGRVILETQPPLLRLLRNCPGVDEVVAKVELGAPRILPEHDLTVSMSSLSGIFGTDIDRVPAPVPYLRPEGDGRLFDELAAPFAANFRVGIVWAGNPLQGDDRKRSCPRRFFDRLAVVPGVRLFGFQKGPARRTWGTVKVDLDEGSRLDFTDWSPHLNDFNDTALAMRRMHLIVSIDSAPAHVAGALGLPVWVPLAFVPAWRYMMDRDDSPWYPTMRLLRQKSRGDWEGVFAEVDARLRDRIAADRSFVKARMSDWTPRPFET